MPDEIPTKEEAVDMLPPNFVGVIRNIMGADLQPTYRDRQWAVNAITHPATTVVGLVEKPIGMCLEIRDAKGSMFLKVKE